MAQKLRSWMVKWMNLAGLLPVPPRHHRHAAAAGPALLLPCASCKATRLCGRGVGGGCGSTSAALQWSRTAEELAMLDLLGGLWLHAKTAELWPVMLEELGLDAEQGQIFEAVIMAEQALLGRDRSPQALELKRRVAAPPVFGD